LIFIEKLAYSFHLGNDKNKTKKAKQISENSKIETSSFNNNAIQNSKHLGKVNNHNLRKYDNNQELIKIVKGTNDIVEDVKELYKKEFEEARLEYNNKQTRNDRKINDYFTQISNDNKHDLVCEIIIELGDMRFWKNKTDEEKYKMIDVYKEQVKDLERLVPSFKVANATIHFDESSPHMHVIGIAIKENCKTGMKKQIGKTSVFTKEKLITIQDEMRKVCIKSFNKFYNANFDLKPKDKGRNIDYKVSQMKDYDNLITEYTKKQNYIHETNNKVKNFVDKQKDINKKLYNLPLNKFNKKEVILPIEFKNELYQYIKEVNEFMKTNVDNSNFIKNVKQVKEDLESNHKRIEELETKNYEQELKIKELEKQIEIRNEYVRQKDKENKILREQNSKLQSSLDNFFNRFDSLLLLIKNKIRNKAMEADNYFKFSNELYSKNIINTEDYYKISKIYNDRNKGIER